MLHFVGAGSGAVDLITLRGANHLKEADVIIYAGSLVNKELLNLCKKDAEIFNSASMTLEEVIDVIENAEKQGKTTVRLHTGDPSLYGAIREQIDILESKNIAYDITPGVSAFSAAAATLHAEYTLPSVSQSLIITRMEGRTPVPEKEKIRLLAAHQTSMAIYLSSSLLDKLQESLLEGGYPPDTPAAIVYKASWPEEKIFRTYLKDLYTTAKENNITKTAIIVIGEFLGKTYDRSKLYDPSFTHECRQASK